MNNNKYASIILLIIVSILASSLMACQQSSKDSNAKTGSQLDNMTAEFLEKYSDYFDDKWVPSQILNYIEEEEFAIADGKFAIEDFENRIMGFIRKVGKDTIKVDEIEWILDEKEPNGFRIENDSGDIVEYKLDDDCRIWLLVDSATMYQISLPDLKKYFKKHDYESKVWHFSVKDDEIVYIVEQYIP